MGQFVEFNADTDEVSKFNGSSITSVPLPQVPTWAAQNSPFAVELTDGAGYYKLLYTPSETPFTITIAGQALTSTGYAGGRPPLRPR